ncbi:MAG TPA: hypothetical protein VJH65_01275 [Candidatus Nanoarchaeia archaeon]|nr:hypothetical protein [Candidatus Nanoarchaeia archaeon]
MDIKSKRSQEEMVGFAVIIVLVAVILLIFLRFGLVQDEDEAIASFEVEGFLDSMLQYTTDCIGDRSEALTIRNLISGCDDEEKCEDGRDKCDIMEKLSEDILEAGWDVGEDKPYKGYRFEIASKEKVLLTLQEGNITSSYKGSSAYVPKGGINVYLDVYS